MPDNKIAFVMPYESNRIANVFTMDLDQRQVLEVFKLDPEEEETVKSLAFDNAGQLYLIKGPAFGSFSPGGKLYKLDLVTKTLSEIEIPLEDREEIVSIHRLEDFLYVRIVKLDPSFRVDSERRVVIEDE